MKQFSYMNRLQLAEREEELALGIRLRGLGRGLVFKAHRHLYHSTLGLRVIKKKKVVVGGQFILILNKF